MGTSAETQRAIREGFTRIGNKWLRGRTEIVKLEGSSLVSVGDSAPNRALIALMNEVTGDMAEFMGIGHDPDIIEAIGEVFYMWKNIQSKPQTLELATRHMQRNTVN